MDSPIVLKSFFRIPGADIPPQEIIFPPDNCRSRLGTCSQQPRHFKFQSVEHEFRRFFLLILENAKRGIFINHSARTWNMNEKKSDVVVYGYRRLFDLRQNQQEFGASGSNDGKMCYWMALANDFPSKSRQKCGSKQRRRWKVYQYQSAMRWETHDRTVRGVWSAGWKSFCFNMFVLLECCFWRSKRKKFKLVLDYLCFTVLYGCQSKREVRHDAIHLCVIND